VSGRRGGRPGLLAFDPSNPGTPEAAQETFAEVCKILGADPDQPDEARQALESLIEASGVEGDQPDDSPAPAGGADGSEGDGAEGVPPPPKKAGTERPKIDAQAVKRGREALGWPEPKPAPGKKPKVERAETPLVTEAARRIAARESPKR